MSQKIIYQLNTPGEMTYWY